MPKHDWIKNPVHKILQKEGLWPFDKINTVLDVACGLSLKSKYLGAAYILGIDIHEPYLRAIEYNGIYNVIKYDVLKLDNIILDNSFEIVYILDIIEHLPKQDALNLIDICKRKCSCAVVTETPLGYVPQNLDILGFGANELQTHRSGWTISELESLGFSCILRKYTMQNIKRHTKLDVDTNIQLIDGIYLK